jgi:serine/threonine protein kinase
VTLIDLGHCKKINNQRTYTICGTTHAMPPEIDNKEGYSYEFDYYSYGILLY